MSDIDAESYAETMAILTAQRASYAQYRTIIDGLRIALERPSRRVIPYLAEQLGNTFAEIEARWTTLLARHRTLGNGFDGPRVQSVRAVSSLVLEDARLAQLSATALGRQLETRGASVRRELEDALRATGSIPTDPTVINAQA